MMKKLYLIFGMFLLMISIALAVECGSNPTSGCTVSTSTTFNQSEYHIDDYINIGASNIVLDCNYSVIDFDEWGGSACILSEFNYTNVTIKNCIIRDCDSAIEIQSGSDFQFINNQIEHSAYGIYIVNGAGSNSIFYNNSFSISSDYMVAIEMQGTINNIQMIYNTINLTQSTPTNAVYFSDEVYNLIFENNEIVNDGSGLVVNYGGDINISDCTIFASVQGIAFGEGNDIYIHNNVIDSTTDGINFGSGNTLNILWNNISGASGSGVYVNAVNNALIDNNKIDNVFEYGIYVSQNTRNVTITHNSISGFDASSLGGIVINQDENNASLDAVISHNYIDMGGFDTDDLSFGISAKGCNPDSCVVPEYLVGVDIFNNTVFDCGDSGLEDYIVTCIYLSYAKDSQIYNNYVYGGSGDAILIFDGSDNIDVYDNLVENSKSGLWVQGNRLSTPVRRAKNIRVYNNTVTSDFAGGSTFEDVTFDDNEFYMYGDGLSFWGSDSNRVMYNLVFRNNIVEELGLSIRGITGITVEDNTITNGGIFIRETYAGDVSDNEIINATWYGIETNDAQINITGNSIKDTFGLKVGTHNNANISFNSINGVSYAGNGGLGIYAFNSNYSHIYQNTISDNERGILVEGSDNVKIQDNNISKLNALDIYIGDITYGIYLASEDAVITGNILDMEDKIAVFTNSIDALIEGNELYSYNCTQYNWITDTGSGNVYSGQACNNYNMSGFPQFRFLIDDDTIDTGIVSYLDLNWQEITGAGFSYTLSYNGGAGWTDITGITVLPYRINFSALPTGSYDFKLQGTTGNEWTSVHEISVSLENDYVESEDEIEDTQINSSVNTTETQSIENTATGTTVNLSSSSGEGIVATSKYKSVPVAVQSPDLLVEVFDVFISSGITGTVRISQTYNEPSLPSAVNENELMLYAWYDSKWNLGSNQALDTFANTVSADFPADKLNGAPLMFGYFGSTAYTASEIPRIALDIFGEAGAQLKVNVPLIILGFVAIIITGFIVTIRTRLR